MADTETIIEKITRSRQRLLEAVAGLSEEEMSRKPGDGWSIRQILHHVAMGERANVELARQALAGNPVRIKEF